MADFTAPWIFFRTVNFEYVAELMEKFWHCYGGTWVFLSGPDRFHVEEWRVVKESMNYELFPFLSKKSAEFRFLLHIVDDYRIDIWFPSQRLNAILPHVESVSARHGILLSKTYAEI